jgi:hypothetical protein
MGHEFFYGLAKGELDAIKVILHPTRFPVEG